MNTNKNNLRATSGEPRETISLGDLIGRPYKDGGRGPQFYDCWGLCMEVARRAGYELPDFNVVISNAARGRLIAEQKQTNFERINKPRPWCIVLFRIFDDNNSQKWHTGTVLEDCRRFIHITGKMSVCITRLDEQFWNLQIEGFYKYVYEEHEEKMIYKNNLCKSVLISG